MSDPFTPPDPQGYPQSGEPPVSPQPDPNNPYGQSAPQYGQPMYPPYGQQPYGQQPYGAPPYGQPMYAHPYVQRTTNGLAIASMVLGILWIYWIGSVLALIFGYIARGQIRQRGQSGDGMAIAGIVLGWIGVGVFLLIFVVFVFGGIVSSTSTGY